MSHLDNVLTSAFVLLSGVMLSSYVLLIGSEAILIIWPDTCVYCPTSGQLLNQECSVSYTLIILHLSAYMDVINGLVLPL